MMFLILFLFCCKSGFGQDMKAIENDLLKSFNKIDSFRGLAINPRGFMGNSLTYEDSLENTNEKLELKLLSYTTKYPATLSYNFPRIKQLAIATSLDHKLRIYSWYTNTIKSDVTGYYSLCQYESDKVHSEILADPRGNHRGIICCFPKIYMLATNSGNKYIIESKFPGGSLDIGLALQFIDIKNDTLNTPELIRSRSRMQNHLFFDYESGSYPKNSKTDELVLFDDNAKSLKIRVISKKLHVTNEWLTYRFNGKYFVKTKE